MQTLGLNTAQRAEYERTLRGTHSRRIDVDVLNLDGDVLSSITPVITGGQVDVDLDAEVTRSCTLEFLDPHNALNFDTDSPDDGALYADRMVRVRYGVFVESMDEYVWCTVFTGPVTGLSRDGAAVAVEAQGKEALSLGPVWRPLTLQKGVRAVGAIWVVLHDRGGETRFDLPEAYAESGKPKTLPRTRSLDRAANIWGTAKNIAWSISRQLFYDGRGVARLRIWPQSVQFTFSSGDGGSLLSTPSVEYQLGDVKNVVEVIGQPPSNSKAKVRGVAFAPRDHPLSPARLGRGGTWRYLVESVEDQNVRSNKDAQELAEQLLKDKLLETVNVSFDALPMPHLDPGDLVRVQTPEFTSTFRLRQFSIPLAPTGSPVMSVGYNKRLSPRKKRIRG